MSESSAKGDLFQNVLALIVKRWGKQGLGKIGASPEQYKPEQWYPFSDFYDLLKDIDDKLGKGDGTVLYRLGYDMVKSDFRWRTIFTDRNPVYVFLSTKRQDTQYRGGKFTAESVGERQIRIEMSEWGCGQIWYEYYRGRLQAVLELTGHVGMVEMNADGDNYIFYVTWQ